MINTIAENDILEEATIKRYDALDKKMSKVAKKALDLTTPNSKL